MMRRGGRLSPDAVRAPWTRWPDSRTALSGRPTMMSPGRPETTCTCTSTSTASMPWNATVCTRVAMRPSPHAQTAPTLAGSALSEH